MASSYESDRDAAADALAFEIRRPDVRRETLVKIAYRVGSGFGSGYGDGNGKG